jgi:hypothetical protein
MHRESRAAQPKSQTLPMSRRNLDTSGSCSEVTPSSKRARVRLSLSPLRSSLSIEVGVPVVTTARVKVMSDVDSEDTKTDTEPLSDSTEDTDEYDDTGDSSHLLRWLDESSLENDSDTAHAESDSEDEATLTVAEQLEEDRIVQQMIRAVFPPLQAALEQPHATAVVSAPCFVAPKWIPHAARLRQDSGPWIETISTTTLSHPTLKPRDCLRSLIEASGRTFGIVPAATIPHFFEPVTSDYVQGYTLTVARAVRANDVSVLQRLQAQGQFVWPCGTAFGDSILHTACRRQCAQVVEFLLLHNQESSLSLNVLDHEASHGRQLRSVRFQNQCGRTPLVDCCWTLRPTASSSCWRTAWLLLAACPDLLYVSDRHGSIPLDHVPPLYFTDWCRFLRQLGAARLAPRHLDSIQPG